MYVSVVVRRCVWNLCREFRESQFYTRENVSRGSLPNKIAFRALFEYREPFRGAEREMRWDPHIFTFYHHSPHYTSLLSSSLAFDIRYDSFSPL
jgi:hypothetical protein